MDNSIFADWKILINYDRIQQILIGEIPIPRIIEILPSSDCPHKCPGCSAQHLRNLKVKFMDFDRLALLIEEIHGLGFPASPVSYVLLSGGEPTMYPRIVDLIKLIRKFKIEIGLYTNGHYFSDNELARTAVENCGFIRIAMDAATSETYFKTHGNRQSFETFCQNIAKLVTYRAHGESNGSTKGTIGLKFLLSALNYGEAGMAASIASELGVDYIRYKTHRNSKYEPSSKQINTARSQISRAAKMLNTSKFEVIDLTHKFRVKKKCFLSPLHPVVSTDGNVYICPNLHPHSDSHRIGNVMFMPFEQIWGSKTHIHAISSISREQCEIYDCPIGQTQEFVMDYLLNPRTNCSAVP